MMNKYEAAVTKISQSINRLAGWSIAAVMALVVSNILLRLIFKKPILGTYEFVGFLTAASIGMALAHCALQNAHIAVDFLMDKLPRRVQAPIDVITKGASLFLLALFSWNIFGYGKRLIMSGEVSPTTKTPFYPYVFAVAGGFAVLSMVMLLQFFKSCEKVIKK